jgi:hypothetical protein
MSETQKIAEAAQRFRDSLKDKGFNIAAERREPIGDQQATRMVPLQMPSDAELEKKVRRLQSENQR